MSRIEDEDTFFDDIWNRLLSINPLHRRIKAVKSFKGFKRHAISMATDDGLDFVYMHFPLPHQPTLFDGTAGKFTAFNFARDGYLDNVLAVDNFFSEMRHKMKKAGSWDKSVIVLSADHGWRKPAPGLNIDSRGRIPLFIKLPGAGAGAVYTEPFDATRMRGLLRALSNGELTGPDDVIAWANNMNPVSKN